MVRRSEGMGRGYHEDLRHGLACSPEPIWESLRASPPSQFAAAEGAELRRLVDELPAKQRRVIAGYFFDERLLPEIARQSGVTVSAVVQSKGKALRKLRERLVRAA